MFLVNYLHEFLIIAYHFVLHSLINLVTEKGGKVYTAFVDFRKAFDYVNRDCL